MTINFQQVIALLPLLIVGLTVLVVMQCIAWRHTHFINNKTLTVIGLTLALLSLWSVAQNGPIDVSPLMRVDGFSTFYTGLVLVASIVTSTLAYAWLADYPGKRDEFYLLVLIATMGGILLASANHVAALFLGIELVSLPMFGLVGYAFRQQRSLEASIKYTLLSAAASSFLLFGMALVYAQSGQLSFTDIGQTLKNHECFTQPLLLAGLGMMIVGLGFKLSLVPFHLWTPDVYQGAPAPVSAFLATVNKIVICAVVMRFFLYVPITHNEAMSLVLAMLAFTSMLFGNLMALSQSNIKRVLGYSSIAHLGYLLVGLISVQAHHTLALETLGVYLAGYIFASLGVFGVINLISSAYPGQDAESLYFYRGLFWYQPLLSVVFTVMLLSLAGVPMTLGFIGKLYVIALGMKSPLGWLTGAVVASSAIGLFYYLRMMVNLYLSPPANLRHNTPSHLVWTTSGVMVLISSLLVLLLGLYPQPLITLVQWAQPML